MVLYTIPNTKQDQFLKKLSLKIRKEPVVITGLPHCGQTTILRKLEEIYPLSSGSENTLCVFAEIISDKVTQQDLENKFLETLQYKLQFPSYIKDISCENLIKELISKNKEILFIINRFQNLVQNHECLTYLQVLRAINPLKVHFLLSSDISLLTKPEDFKDAGPLASTNIVSIPLLGKKEVINSIDYFETFFGWDIPKKYASQIHKLSGGIPGIVKYLIRYISIEKPKKINKKKLLKDPSIVQKVEEIFIKLKENDLSNVHSSSKKQKTILKNLGVFNEKGLISIGLLESFIQNPQSPKSDIPLKKTLSKQEYLLFVYFKSKLEDLITIDEISKTLWEEQELEKFSPWAIYKVLSTLNKKIKKYGYTIRNYRGRGYSLIKTN